MDNNIKNNAEVTFMWHNCSFDSSNLPNKSGLYLVNRFGKGFAIQQFFKKGDVIDQISIENCGVLRAIIANTDSFYQKTDVFLYEKISDVVAWAEIPENADEFMNIFIDRKG